MRFALLSALGLALCLAHAGQTQHRVDRSTVIGLWKVDIPNTSIPGLKAAENKEMTTMRLLVSRDGSYRVSGVFRQSTGKWTLKDRIVSFRPVKGQPNPDPLTISNDGSRMVSSVKVDKDVIKITFVRTNK